MNVAYFSPLPPDRSGIADYSRELLPHLGRGVNLTLFYDEPDNVDADLRAQFAIEPVAAYPARRSLFDLALYQMGNSRWHETIYNTLRRFPGVVTLHDVNLHHFMSDRAGRHHNYDLYTREMGYATGIDGAYRAWAIQTGRAGHPLAEMCLHERVIHASLGIIVHSQYARYQVAAAAGTRPLTVIPLLDMSGGRQGKSRRAQLNLPPEAVIFASLGQITSARQFELALATFDQLAQTLPHIYYLLVGEAGSDVDLDQLITNCGAAERVITTGYVNSADEFIDWLATADIVVNIRYPTMGETSSVALQALAVGRPLIVYDHGSYAELPDAAARKVPPLDQPALLATMSELAQLAVLRQEMGAAGAKFAAEYHTPAQAARHYVNFMEQVLRNIDRKFGGSGQQVKVNNVV
jgi:glycosyltransferase involved in cell wall biosynthesis